MDGFLGIREFENKYMDHFKCVAKLFSMYSTKEQLEKLASRSDIDLACAYEFHEMKKIALSEHGLDYKSFHPQYYSKNNENITKKTHE
jgi:hypothetical protein